MLTRLRQEQLKTEIILHLWWKLPVVLTA